MPSRDQQLLDAAIEVLASGGPRQLTHRAVDTAAGVPLGSTSNCFRTRDALLVGVLRRVLERDVAAWQALVPERVATVDDLADGLGHLVSDQVGAHRSLSQARRAIFLEAATNPALRAEIVSGRSELAAWLGPVLVELGSAAPEAHVRAVLALMDGLIGHQLTLDDPELEPALPIAALLRGVLAPGRRRAASRTRRR